MSYIGNIPGENFISFAKQNFTIVNSQTAYTLDFAVADENEIRLVINNVVQEPGSGKAYTASGTTLTLSSALTNGTDEMYCVFLGKARETVTVPDITRDKLNLISDASNPSLIAKGTSGVSEGYIQLNCAENSHGIKLKSPPHSAGQSYTLTFPQSITNNTFLKTDGSGNLSFAAAADNTPAFMATRSGGDQTISSSSYTLMSFNNEIIDTDSAYDNSAYTFTVPSGKNGTYLIGGQVAKNSSGSTDRLILKITKTTGGSESSFLFGEAYSKDYAKATSSKICTLAVGDILKMYAYQNTGGSVPIEQGEENSFFFAIKLG